MLRVNTVEPAPMKVIVVMPAPFKLRSRSREMTAIRREEKPSGGRERTDHCQSGAAIPQCGRRGGRDPGRAGAPANRRPAVVFASRRGQPQKEDRMRLKVGCRLTYELPQPTPMIAVLNIHFSRFGDLDRPDHLVTAPAVPIGSYRDGSATGAAGIVAPAGRFAIRTDAVFRDSGAADRRARRRAAPGRGPPRRDPRLPARQPLLRDRPAVRDRVAAFGSSRPAGRGCRRSATSSTTTSVRLPARAAHPHRLRRPTGAHRRMPRLRPSRHRPLPLHEHSGALLHRLSRRYRHAADRSPDGLRGLDRGLSRRPLAHLRPAQQHSAHRPDPDRARPRRRRRPAHTYTFGPNMLAGGFEVWTDPV